MVTRLIIFVKRHWGTLAMVLGVMRTELVVAEVVQTQTKHLYTLEKSHLPTQ